MLRRLIAFALAAAIAAAGLWALWPRPVAVETATVERRSIEVTVEEEGKARIREVFTVSAPITGRLMRLDLRPGDRVLAGETVLASIRPVAPGLLDARARKIAEAAAAAARATVELASAQVNQAEAQSSFMDSEFNRATQLVRRGTISERAFDKASLDAAVAHAELASTKANLLVRQRELESAEAALIEGETGATAVACCVDVKAPVTGEVLRVLTESEQVVPAGTPLTELGDPADLEIAVDLLSRDAVRIAPGAEATIDGWGGPPLAAQVERIDPAAVTKVSALGIEEQRVSVVLKLTGPPTTRNRLGHGFRVVARIRLWRGDNLVAVPMGALFRTGADWAVFTVRDGRAQLTRIEIGQRNDDFAEVKTGLAEGDVVILHPSDRVTGGAAVAQ